MTNEKPLVVVKAGVDVMWEVIREDGGYGRDSVVGKGEAPLRHGGGGGIHERVFGAENRDISRGQGSGGHRGSEVLALGRGDEDIVGVDGDILMEWGEEEGIKNFLSYLGRRGRHR